MTETSYTAWDDKLYQWPPPDGWYQASDGKWWPEGYGPPTEAEAGTAAATDDLAQSGADESAGSGATSAPTTDDAGDTVAGGTDIDTGAGAGFGRGAASNGAVADNGVAADTTTTADTDDTALDPDGPDTADVDPDVATAQADTGTDTEADAGAGLAGFGVAADTGSRLADTAASAPERETDTADGALGRALDGIRAGRTAAADEAGDVIADGGDGLAAARDRLGRTSDRFGVAGETFAKGAERAGEASSGGADSAGHDFSGPGLGRASATGLPDINDVLPTEELRVGAARAAEIADSSQGPEPDEAVGSDDGAGSEGDGAEGAEASGEAAANAASETITTAFDAGQQAAGEVGASATQALPLDLPAPDSGPAATSGPGPGSSVADRASEALSRAAEAEAAPTPSVFDREPLAGGFDPSGEKTSELSSDDLARLDAGLESPPPAGDAAPPSAGDAAPPSSGGDQPAVAASDVDFGTLPPPPSDGLGAPPPPADLETLPPPGFEAPPPSGQPADAALPPPPGFEAPAAGLGLGESLPPLGGASAPPPDLGEDTVPPPPGVADSAAPSGASGPDAPAPDETLLGSFGDLTAPAPSSFEAAPPSPGSAEPGFGSPLDGGAPTPAAPAMGAFDAPTTALPGDAAAAPLGRPLEGTEGSGLPPAVPGLDPRAALDDKPKGGVSRLLLLIGLGVLALVVLGAALYFVFGGDDDGDATAAAQTGPGSVAEPHARTTGVEVFYPDGGVDQRWVVEVLEPVRDVTAESAEIPEGGDVFAAIRIRVRNQDGVDGASLGDLHFNAVTAAGEVIEREANSCSIPGADLDFGASLALGAQTEGAVCWEVPPAALAGLLLGLESDKVAGRVHIALQ